MMAALLFPLALLGAAAVLVRLWLHLRRDEHADQIEFSAMQFLDEAPVMQSRPVRLLLPSSTHSQSTRPISIRWVARTVRASGTI